MFKNVDETGLKVVVRRKELKKMRQYIWACSQVQPHIIGCATDGNYLLQKKCHSSIFKYPDLKTVDIKASQTKKYF